MRHVYIAADADGRHKIGVTNNPRARCLQLSRDLGGIAVEMVHIEPQSSSALEIERHAHQALAALHDGGEWFRVDRSVAISALTMAKLSVAPLTAPSLPPPQVFLPPPKVRLRPGRPPQFKDPEPLTIKAERSFWREVDAWAEQQPGKPKRSTAARMLIEIALDRHQASD
jgi:hypothetical protein